MARIKTFNPNKPARMGAEIYDRYRYNLGVHAQRLLLGLAQSLDLTADIFPEWEVDIRSLFSYLAIENNNARYEIVRKAFFEITENPLQYRINDKHWGSHPWMGVHFNAEENNFVKIEFTNQVKPFLLNLRQYVELKPKHYLKLTTPYATWLYPMLKAKMPLSKTHFKKQIVEVEFTISRLREYTYTENAKAYDETTNFLMRVIGIKKNQKTKSWEILKGSGALHEINEFTDIDVKAEGVKTGRSYDRVVFWVSLKEADAKERVGLNAKNTAKQKYPSLFDPNKSKTILNRISMQSLMKNAAQSNMSIQEYARVAGYNIVGEYAYKKQ